MDNEAKFTRDYCIPRVESRLALLRLEHPVSKHDLDQIGKWLDLLKDSLEDETEVKDSQNGNLPIESES